MEELGEDSWGSSEFSNPATLPWVTGTKGATGTLRLQILGDPDCQCRHPHTSSQWRTEPQIHQSESQRAAPVRCVPPRPTGHMWKQGKARRTRRYSSYLPENCFSRNEDGGKESQAEESQDLRAGLTLYPVSPFFFGSPPETLGTRPDWERCLLIDIVPKGPQ